MCQKYEKSEVPDIIEGVPVCSEELGRQTKRYSEKADEGRVVFQIPDESDRQNRYEKNNITIIKKITKKNL